MIFHDRVRDIDSALWLTPIAQIFERMDAAYDKVSEAYGFHCRGCADNCCLTRFHHHTLAETLYLKRGFEGLSDDLKVELKDKARDVVEKTRKADEKGETPRIMCPLNHEGLCMLYVYRPMICRLHGLAHELIKPGQSPVLSEGCGLFTEKTRSMDYIPFDRTPFYVDMALLEQNLRKVSGFTDRLKHTVAEIILL